MLRASLFRLPVIVTFLNSAALGTVLALMTYYYHSAPDLHPFGSNSELNVSSRIASQLWHSHSVVGVLLLFTSALA